MNWRPLPWWSRMHFREYRCIVCNSVLRVHPSQNSVTEYVPTDRCYNCNYEISYSLSTHNETSSQQFLQTRLPLVQAAEQIADELAEASTPLPSTHIPIDEFWGPDDEGNPEPWMSDENPEAHDERIRNLWAVPYPQTHGLNRLPATYPVPPGGDAHPADNPPEGDADPVDDEPEGDEPEGDEPEGDEPEGDEPEGGAPDRDTHQADDAPAPHQSPDEPEEGLNIMRGL
ncbi:hypothetical protein BKA60DRAFT_650675 [Fusarium oxysporum]|nr:hypothetical protein BKA60DRAFT_650675 [Fusarium oxysporum]